MNKPTNKKTTKTLYTLALIAGAAMLTFIVLADGLSRDGAKTIMTGLNQYAHLPLVWPATNGTGSLTNDGLGNLGWGDTAPPPVAPQAWGADPGSGGITNASLPVIISDGGGFYNAYFQGGGLGWFADRTIGIDGHGQFRVGGFGTPGLLDVKNPSGVSQIQLNANGTTFFGAGALNIAQNGDLSRIKGVTYSWPANNAAGTLSDDGSGNLKWAAGLRTNINVLVSGGATYQLQFTNGILGGVVPQ
jgi:hypothetical protein